ncbi:hypothetical protein V6N11_022114 [Hibiscus sabdariffa]|uniref:Ribonuclease H1 N-terminal domain-containing protein n=1 Tax=Hibiscus sabdariffa TaxID=183260 RepID=A0ABR2TJ67_9ROSI
MSDQKIKMEKYYVVFHGKKADIYRSWIECAHMIIGIKGSRFESFESESDAKEALDKYQGKEVEAKTDIKELSANILFAYILDTTIYIWADHSNDLLSSVFRHSILFTGNHSDYV